MTTWYLIFNKCNVSVGLIYQRECHIKQKRSKWGQKVKGQDLEKPLNLTPTEKNVCFFHPNYNFIIDCWVSICRAFTISLPLITDSVIFKITSTILKIRDYYDIIANPFPGCMCSSCFSSCLTCRHTSHSNTKPAISIKGVGKCWLPGDKYKQIRSEKGGKLANWRYSQRRWGWIFYSGVFVNAPCQAKCITDALRFCNWSWKWIAKRPGLNWMT